MRSAPEVYVRQIGSDAEPVAFCHGLFGQGRNWTQIAKAISAEHSALLIDMPDHGRSAWREEFTYPDAADRVAAVLPRNEPVTLVGHSMGGKIAMLIALRHPERVRSLCVVDVAPVSYGHASEFTGYIQAMQAIDLDALQRRDDADAALAEAVPQEAVRGFLLQNLRNDGERWFWQANLEVISRDLDQVTGWPEAQVSGQRYDGPVLWVAGGGSDYIAEEHHPSMQRLFPQVRRVVIKDAGHWVHSERPEVFIEVLRRFLAGATR